MDWWDWLASNKGWVFSGIGVLILSLIIGAIRWFITHERRQAKLPPEIHNEARDMKDSIVYQAGGDINVDNSVKKK